MTRSSRMLVGLPVVLTLCFFGCRSGPEVQQTDGRHPRSKYAKCRGVDSLGGCQGYVPSLEELIARPEWYDGLTVGVEGVMAYEREEAALYPSMEAYEHLNGRSAVWLYPGQPCEGCAALHGTWVEVIGTFDAAERGHMGMFAGGISKIEIIATAPLVRGPVPMTPSRAELFGEAKYYSARAVQMSGVLSLEDGEIVLYSSRAEYERRSDPNGLWLRTSERCDRCLALNGKSATVSGVFVAGDRGVSGRFRGGISGFKVVEPLKRITFPNSAVRPPEVAR